MKYLHNKISTFLIIAISVSSPSYSLAEEVGNSNERKQTKKNSGDGYFLSVGIGYVSQESPLTEETNDLQLVFSGRYQWKGLFAEIASDPSRDNVLPAVGYNFYSTDHWNLDVIAAATDGGTRLNYQVAGESREISSGSTRGAGFRATGAWGNTLLQLAVLQSISEDFRSDSAIDYGSVWLGHRWQVKNWSVSGLVGATYRSSGLTDHLFGVTESEADELLKEYQPPSGIDYTAQIDLTYPVRNNLIFQMYSKHTKYSDAVLDSPIIEVVREFDNRPEKGLEFGILLNYVF